MNVARRPTRRGIKKFIDRWSTEIKQEPVGDLISTDDAVQAIREGKEDNARRDGRGTDENGAVRS